MHQKIAILSDLHCHPKRLKHSDSLLHFDAPKAPANKHPIASLLRYIKAESLTADVLLVPGDLTNRMHPRGIRAGWEFCRQVADKLGAKLVAASVGNHDVDYLKALGRSPFGPAKSLQRDYPVPTAKARASFWKQGFCIIERGPLRILVVNSILQYKDPAEVKRGRLNEEQLEVLHDSLSGLPRSQFQVALMHHHPVQHEILGLGSEDLMKNGESLTSILVEFGFDIAVHGHKHHSRILYAAGATDSLVVFAAGSVAATTERGLLSNTRNLFHIVDLDDDAVPSCGRHGVLHSWEFHLHRGWRPATVGAADIPAVTGFGCRPDFAALSKAIADWFDSEVGVGKPGFFDWRDLVGKFPQLDYIVPADAEKLAGILKLKHAIEFVPAPPDSPARVGRLSKKRKR